MPKIQPYWKIIIWSLMIIILSGFPGKSLEELFSWDRLFSFDKLAHAIIYFIQMLLLFPVFYNAFPQRGFMFSAILSLLITIAFGAAMELMQAYVFSDRSGDMMDVLANSFGSLLAFFYFLARKSRYKNEAIH